MVKQLDVGYFQKKLRAMQADNKELAKQVSNSAQTVTLDQNSVGRLSRMDALQGQAMAQANVDRQLALRHSIAEALKRVEIGEYGRCFECGEHIASARLDIDPVAEFCISCAELQEAN